MIDALCLFALLDVPQLWFAAPLVVAFSLVYAGTRSENPREIFRRALSVGGILFFFLLLVALILYWLV